jgi:aryl-alcohol dehydrogenase-like predicted oxidoreductase
MAGPSEFPPRVLGRTGLMVGALGQSASYGAPTKAIEECFEQGMNYLYYGSLRRAAFAQAVRNLAPQRERMVLVVQSYTRLPLLMRGSVQRALRQLRTDHADVLLLGWWDQRPWESILETAVRLREEGLVRFIGLSGHNRPLFAKLTEALDVFHVRYNAAHRGAEQDVFPNLPAGGPGIVAYTATSWKQLLGDRRIPAAERRPTAADCYRFVLTNPSVDVSMTGPADADQARQSLEALRHGPMDPDELAWMRRVGDAIYGRT